jgi:hypothetical protein
MTLGFSIANTSELKHIAKPTAEINNFIHNITGIRWGNLTAQKKISHHAVVIYSCPKDNRHPCCIAFVLQLIAGSKIRHFKPTYEKTNHHDHLRHRRYRYHHHSGRMGTQKKERTKGGAHPGGTAT